MTPDTDPPPPVTDPGVKASDHKNTPLLDVWGSDGMKALDEKHITMLDPIWLNQFEEEQQKEAFFHSILPILTLRFDEDNPYKDRVKVIEAREHNWESIFLSKDFNVDEPLAEYKKDPWTFLKQLHYFAVIQRAKAMYEKLWVRCAEAFFLGLAHYMMHQKMPLGSNGGGVFENGKKEIVMATDTVEDLLTSAEIAIIRAWEAEAVIPFDKR